MRCRTITGLSTITDDTPILGFENRPEPIPGVDEVLIRVSVCGVCHTEIDEIEGRTPPPLFPVIPGHQVVGRIVAAGPHSTPASDQPLASGSASAPGDLIGARVGVAWIGRSCEACSHCRAGRENLCPEFRATGRDLDGGYSELMAAHRAFVHPIPKRLQDFEAAPILCAGAVGYRALRMTGISDGAVLGFAGFGASAHLVLQMARYLYPNTTLCVFARGEQARRLALDLGAAWAGSFCEAPPARLDAVIDTTPAWAPVLAALEQLSPGGRLVINAIGKDNSIDKQRLLELDYSRHLWEEKEIKSVANVTRADVRESLQLAERVPLKPQVTPFTLEDADQALRRVKRGGGTGAVVLAVS